MNTTLNGKTEDVAAAAMAVTSALLRRLVTAGVVKKPQALQIIAEAREMVTSSVGAQRVISSLADYFSDGTGD